MKNQLWRVLLISLMIVGILFLAACNETTTDQPTDEKVEKKEEVKKEEPVKEVEVPPEDGPMTKYDPPITITTIREANDTVKFKEGEDIDNNVWSQAYEEILGIKLEYLWVASTADQFKQKTNVMVASDEIPDVFGVNDPVIFTQLAEADKLADLSGLLEAYGTPHFQKDLAAWGTEIIDAVTVDGEMLALPYPGGGPDGATVLWIKKDWLDSMGKAVPTTMDELIQLAYDFAEADPTGNGTYGLALNKDLFGGFAGLDGFFNGYGAYPTIWHKDGSGSVVYGSVTPETRVALEQLAKMFVDDLIDPEFGVKDGGKVGETTTQNRVGIQFGAQWNSIWPLNGNINEDETAYWQTYDLVYKDGVEPLVRSNLSISQYYMVRKDFEYPEVVIKLSNLAHDMLFGEDPATAPMYGWGLDGMELFKYRIIDTSIYGKNQIAQQKIAVALKSNDTSPLNGEEMVYYTNVKAFADGDRMLYGHWAVFGPDGSQKLLGEWVNDDRILYNTLIGSPVDAWLENGSTLNDLRLEVFTKIITGEEPIEAFDKFVDDWNALGGSDATAQMNARYK